MIAKFNLYDFIANLVPGLTFIWALEQLGLLIGWTSPFPMSGQLAETSVLVVLSYVVRPSSTDVAAPTRRDNGR